MQVIQKIEPQAPQGEQGLITAYKREEIELIKDTVAKGATDAELKFFLYTAQLRGLNPLAKQIHFQKRWNKRENRQVMVIITAIDGYRLIADRTGKYAGSDDPIFDDEESPKKATVTVYKLVGGIRCAFTASARWGEYYPGEQGGQMWNKMPLTMLGKCAEALALRKAFPEELSGLYIREEMDQAGSEMDQPEAPTIEYDHQDPDAVSPPPPEEDPGNFQGAAAGTSRSSGATPNVDRYIGTEEQKTRLKETLRRLKINSANVMVAMHKAFLKAELEMEHFDAGVKEWISENLLKKKT